MTDSAKAIQAKIHSSIYMQVKEKGFATPVDVLIDIGYLSKKDYENWMFGRIDYLERVCKVNLHKLSFINHEIRSYAHSHGLKPSWKDYRKWGKGVKIRLRFSKYNNPNVEKLYATHYVGPWKKSETIIYQEAEHGDHGDAKSGTKVENHDKSGADKSQGRDDKSCS